MYAIVDEVIADAVVADWPAVAVVCVIGDVAAAWETEVRPCDVNDDDGRSDRGGGLSRSRFPIETGIAAVAFANKGRELSR